MSTLTTPQSEPRHEQPFECAQCQDATTLVIESYKIRIDSNPTIIIDSDCLNCGSVYHQTLPFDQRYLLVHDGSPVRDLYGAMLVHCGEPMQPAATEANQLFIELICKCGYRNDIYLT